MTEPASKVRAASPAVSSPSLARRHATGPQSAPAVVHEVLAAPGLPLDAAVCSSLGSAYGHDFSQVRVHTDARAAASADAVRARAYTVGQHVVFGAGEYRPGDPVGRQLLAHELAHVVQQSGVSIPAAGERIPVSRPGDPAEREAGMHLAGHRTGLMLARQPVARQGQAAPPQAATVERVVVHRSESDEKLLRQIVDYLMLAAPGSRPSS